MGKPKLPDDFLKRCRSVTAKRPKTVIDHIVKHGFITTEQLKNDYGYNHPPRAARDVKDNGIPLEMFRVEGRDGRKIAAYRFGDPAKARFDRQTGRKALGQAIRRKLIALHGAVCAIYQVPFPERELQVDHRVPFEVLGDVRNAEQKTEDYMLLCGSANRAKSWSCEHCVNWIEQKKPEVCRSCYWAYPDDYSHIAMRQIRRTDIIWVDQEIEVYEKLKRKTIELQKKLPDAVKEIIRKHIQ